MADYTGFSDGSTLDAAALDAKTVTPLNEIGGDDLEDGIITATAGPNIQFTVGAEAANVIAVTVQIEKHDGADIVLEDAAMLMWLADSNTDSTVAVTAPSGGWSATTGKIPWEITTNKVAMLHTDATGTFIMDITETGGDTWYLWVQAGSRIHVSDAITFT